LIQHVIQNKPDALFFLGSTGEGLYFEDKIEEKKKLLNLIREIDAQYPNLPILVGVYGNSPRRVIAAW